MSPLELIGSVSVDAGMIMIGDPCYTLPTDAPRRSANVRDWQSFCQIADRRGLNEIGFVEPVGEGIGVVVAPPWGDGDYPVYVERTEGGQIRRIVIDVQPDLSDEAPEEAWCDHCGVLEIHRPCDEHVFGCGHCARCDHCGL